MKETTACKTVYNGALTQAIFYMHLTLYHFFPSLQNKFLVTCHLSAHLAYVAFNVVPGEFQEHITIVLLDVFNQCLSSPEYATTKLKYGQGIINMVFNCQLRQAMTISMGKYTG